MKNKLGNGEITNFNYDELPSQISVTIRESFPEEITVHSTSFQHFLFNVQYLIEKGYSFSLDGQKFPSGTIGHYKATMLKKQSVEKNKKIKS